MKTSVLKTSAVLPVFIFMVLLASCKKDAIKMPMPPLAVTAAPIAGFVYSVSGTMAPVIVTFVNTSMNATSVTWDFGDGDVSNSQVVKKEFDHGGMHEIKLIATGPGSIDTKTAQIQVADEAKHLTIKSFTIIATNTRNPENEPAETEYPDIYFKLGEVSGTGTVLFTSNVVKDVSIFPLTWLTNIDLDFGSDPGKKYMIHLWDDDIVSPDDLIDELELVPASFMTIKNYYPGEITLSKGSSAIKLIVEWH